MSVSQAEGRLALSRGINWAQQCVQLGWEHVSQGVHQQSALQHADFFCCCCLAEALFCAAAVLCFANSDVCFIACCRFLHVGVLA